MDIKNVDIDSVKANAWRLEVDSELRAVEELLDQVSHVCTEMPGEKDALIETIEKVGTGLESTWSALSRGFKEACDDVGKAISNIIDRGQRAVDDLQSFWDRIPK